jgi:Rps23 Pro-64 3,4-dihydroxylase Tpa1-like proline 4-hydroxylase
MDYYIAIKNNWDDVVVHVYNPSYSRSGSRRVTVQGWFRQKHETLSKPS